MSNECVLNQFTDPPYQTEKNKFSSQPSENPSISGRIEPPVSRSGMSWIIGVLVHLVGDNALERR